MPTVFPIPSALPQLPFSQLLQQGQGPRGLATYPDVLAALLGGDIPDDGGEQIGVAAPTQVSPFQQPGSLLDALSGVPSHWNNPAIREMQLPPLAQGIRQIQPALADAITRQMVHETLKAKRR